MATFMKELMLMDFIDDWCISYRARLAINQNLEHWKEGRHEKAYKKIKKILKDRRYK